MSGEFPDHIPDIPPAMSVEKLSCSRNNVANALPVDLPPPPLPSSGSYGHCVPPSSHAFSCMPPVSLSSLPYIFPPYDYSTRPLLPLAEPTTDSAYLGYQPPDARNYSTPTFPGPFPYGLPPFPGDQTLGSLPSIPVYTSTEGGDFSNGSSSENKSLADNSQNIHQGQPSVQPILPPPPPLQGVPNFSLVPPPHFFSGRYPPPPPAHMGSSILQHPPDLTSCLEMIKQSIDNAPFSTMESDADSIIALSPGTEQVPSPIKVDKMFEFSATNVAEQELALSQYEVQIHKVQRIPNLDSSNHASDAETTDVQPLTSAYSAAMPDNDVPQESVGNTEQLSGQFAKSSAVQTDVVESEETSDDDGDDDEDDDDEEDDDEDDESESENESESDDETENDEEVPKNSGKFDQKIETTQDSITYSHNSDLDSCEEIPKVDSPFTRIRPSLLKSYRASEKYRDKKRSKKKRMLDILPPISPCESSNKPKRKYTTQKINSLDQENDSEIASGSEYMSESDAAQVLMPAVNNLAMKANTEFVETKSNLGSEENVVSETVEFESPLTSTSTSGSFPNQDASLSKDAMSFVEYVAPENVEVLQSYEGPVVGYEQSKQGKPTECSERSQIDSYNGVKGISQEQDDGNNYMKQTDQHTSNYTHVKDYTTTEADFEEHKLQRYDENYKELVIQQPREINESDHVSKSEVNSVHKEQDFSAIGNNKSSYQEEMFDNSQSKEDYLSVYSKTQYKDLPQEADLVNDDRDKEPEKGTEMASYIQYYGTARGEVVQEQMANYDSIPGIHDSNDNMYLKDSDLTNLSSEYSLGFVKNSKTELNIEDTGMLCSNSQHDANPYAYEGSLKSRTPNVENYESSIISRTTAIENFEYTQTPLVDNHESSANSQTSLFANYENSINFRTSVLENNNTSVDNRISVAENNVVNNFNYINHYHELFPENYESSKSLKESQPLEDNIPLSAEWCNNNLKDVLAEVNIKTCSSEPNNLGHTTTGSIMSNTTVSSLPYVTSCYETAALFPDRNYNNIQSSDIVTVLTTPSNLKHSTHSVSGIYSSSALQNHSFNSTCVTSSLPVLNGNDNLSSSLSIIKSTALSVSPTTSLPVESISVSKPSASVISSSVAISKPALSTMTVSVGNKQQVFTTASSSTVPRTLATSTKLATAITIPNELLQRTKMTNGMCAIFIQPLKNEISNPIIISRNDIQSASADGVVIQKISSKVETLTSKETVTQGKVIIKTKPKTIYPKPPSAQFEGKEKIGNKKKSRKVTPVLSTDLEGVSFAKGVFCVDCNKMYATECSIHDTHYTTVSDAVLTKARSSIPAELALRSMYNQDTADYIGVLSRKYVPCRTKFGPLQGKKTTKEQLENPENTAYVWEIFDEENPNVVLDCRSEDDANWLMFVKRARSSLEQNMLVYQEGHDIYFITIKDIEANVELLYWYGKDYAVMLGVCTEPEDSFRCQSCHRQFPDMNGLRTHIKAAHPLLNTYVHRCNECGKVFKNKSILSRHQKATHAKLKSYTCPVCQKAFTDRNNQRRHTKLHSEDARKFKCDECGQKFTQKTHLSDHMATHSGERNFQCRFCDKRFFRKQDSRHHEKTVHIIDKEYKCDLCDTVFYSLRYYKVHCKIHQEKEFKCNNCSKEFTQKVHLKIHLARIHKTSLTAWEKETGYKPKKKVA